MTRDTFETALDQGRLQTRVLQTEGPKWYDCRRNGRTRTWKTDPARFEIPVKFRLRDCVRVKSDHFNNGLIDERFRIKPTPKA